MAANKADSTSVRRPLVIAHRGASAISPENTLEAFHLAILLGADGIEFDVQLSADGEPVVIHDRRVDRTTSARGLVSSFTSSELSTLDAGRSFERSLAHRPRRRARISAGLESVKRGLGLVEQFGADAPAGNRRVPTLESALDLLSSAPPLRIYIEIKGEPGTRPVLLEETLKIVKRYRIRRTVTLISFDPQTIGSVPASAPDIRTGVLIGAPLHRLPRFHSIARTAEDAQASEVALHYSLATKRLVSSLHDRGLAVAAWTANSKIIMRRLLAAGVDSIITNYPGRLNEVISSLSTIGSSPGPPSARARRRPPQDERDSQE
ncbi:MAG TPA: glycerophosphodiester phosphodiesterase family protein [Blastocatellia bacterium]|nr:glycerophosphodiester phosphodiesterase family protein [Blastocatellia bacterium]